MTARISDITKALKKSGVSSVVLPLAKLLWQNVPSNDMAPFGLSEQMELTRQTMDLVSKRKPGTARISVFNPAIQDGHSDQISVVQIINDDMPFLFDSTVSLMSEYDYQISLIAHPVISVERAPNGNLVQLSEQMRDDGAFIRESLMHIHINRLESASERKELEAEISRTLSDVRAAVLDWRLMQARIHQAIEAYQQNPPPVPVEELTESTAFLQWLLDNHFTILGIRDYRFEGDSETGALAAINKTGMGILRDPKSKVLARGSTTEAITPKIRAYLRRPSPLIISKSDTNSKVHRRTALDYIGIKQFDNDGELAGEIRIVGLFTSTAYTSSPRYIPLIRRKIESAIAMSGLSTQSHSGKGMLNVLETFPRDELFQMETKALHDMTVGIMRLEERPHTKLFVRYDRFDRFISAFVYIPRDRFNSGIRLKVGDQLAAAFDGKVTNFSPFFSDTPLVRVHFIISRNIDATAKPDVEKLENEITESVRTWDDRLADVINAGFKAKKAYELKKRYLGAFPAGYQEAFTPSSAIYDVRAVENLAEGDGVGVHFFNIQKEPRNRCRLKLYHYDKAISLSARLPILENMGLRATEESTFTAMPGTNGDARLVFIHEVVLLSDDGSDIDMQTLADNLENCFLATWNRQAENDRFNALVLKADFNWRDAALMRACAKYLRQVGIAYSSDYMATALVKHAAIARTLLEVFYIRFDISRKNPKGKIASKADRRPLISKLAAQISSQLLNVPSLDEDLIFRRYLNLIRSINRTNYFQRFDGQLPPTISFKINSVDIEELPAPKPFAEIFVYAPDVEGIHLRGGKIARGGLRWSDRPEDFRTEVLGLAKAQNVKNAVIVPVGAKGGFVPKNMPVDGTREEVFAEGTRVYKMFINALLDISDNLQGEKVIPPKEILRNDEDDPYLVVAADKGTATFSDTANAISQAHNFWLDDAFASGGSAGYDHKKMGITARGGWEAVKRHFREMDTDTQSTPFTAIGVGDMSGDVFGNGMLLSKKTRLLAAFDHRDIFIDPDPNPEQSHKERQRLFNLPRSSWKDYNEKLISTGGGIFSRQLKAIPLSKEIRKQTGLEGKTATPNQLIQAILKMSADLLWFGGIGTYVKSSLENNADVGDRANDKIRISASELNVKVVGEGANLGITQKARIEFALGGGRINTDAIDNSAGVNSSDVEVNFKIALGAAEAAGKLKRPQRNKLLAAMTDDVAELVLRNNYLQTLCLSMCQVRATSEFGYTKRLMENMENDGLLDRKLEDLPDGTALADREATGAGFTRPELSVLIAYAKIALFDDLIETDVPDDPYFESQLFRYFPPKMAKKFRPEVINHKLRREIITTLLANSVINRGGPTFVYRLMEETGHRPSDIAKAFIVARDAFGFTELNDQIDQLDNKISGNVQIRLYVELQRVLRRATVWFLLNVDFSEGLDQLVAHYRKGLESLSGNFDKALPAAGRETIKAKYASYSAENIPDAIAKTFSQLRHMQRGPDIVQVASRTKQPITTVARTFFDVASGLDIDRLFGQSGQIVANDYYDRLAINRTLDGIVQTHRSLVMEIMSSKSKNDRNWQSWSSANQAAVERVQATMEDLLKGREFNLAKLAVAASQLSDLSV
jgi:glutamate dehydrogenase